MIKLVLGIVVGVLSLRGWQEYKARTKHKSNMEFVAKQNKENA